MAGAVQLIKITFEILFTYIIAALRISAGWAILITALFYSMHYVVPEGTNLYKGIYSLKGMLFNAAIFFICILAFVSCAISWHRFVLLNVISNIIISLPPIPLILPYLFRCIIIVFSAAIIGAVSFILVSLITPFFHQIMGGNRIAIFFFVPINFTAIYIQFRLGISLPAIAIGKSDYSIEQSWQLSKKINGTIIWISLFTTLIWFVVSRANYMIVLKFTPLDDFTFLMLPVIIILEWLFVMFYVGLLTSLYVKASEAHKI